MMSEIILKHDAQGFLIGEKIDLRLQKQGDYLRDIRTNTRRILQVLDAGQKRQAAAMGAQTAAAVAAQPRRKTAFGLVGLKSQNEGLPAEKASTPPKSASSSAAQHVKKKGGGATHPLTHRFFLQSQKAALPEKATAAQPIQKTTIEVSGVLPEKAAHPAQDAARDGKGRFVKAADGGTQGADAGNSSARDSRGRFAKGAASAGDDEAWQQQSLPARIGQNVAAAVAEAGQALQQSDPAVAAVQEVVQPLARGWQMVRGSAERRAAQRQEGWLKKIFKSVQNIEDRPEQKRGGFGLMLAAFAARLAAAFAPLIAALGALTRAVGLGGLGSKTGSVTVPDGADKAADKAKGKGKWAARLGGMMRRLPLVGALAAGGAAAADIYAAQSDENRSSADKARSMGGTLGGLGAALAAGAAGAKLGAATGAVGGPVGVAAGAVIGGAAGAFFGEKAGQIVGEKIGGFVHDMRRADIVGSIEAAFADIKSGALSAFDSFTQKATFALSNIWTGAKEQFNQTISPIIQPIIKPVKPIIDGADAALSAVRSAGHKAIEHVSGRAATRRAALELAARQAGITHPQERAMFMAQMHHESGSFTSMQESFNYRSAEQIMRVSATARARGRAAVEAAREQGPAAVAELMYGGRMGNKEAGDGFKYRGRGFVQLTGRDNYTAASKDLGIDLVNHPDLAADPKIAAQLAVWFWRKNPQLAKSARAGDVLQSTKMINGGTNGIDDREKLFAKYTSEYAHSPQKLSEGAPRPKTTFGLVGLKSPEGRKADEKTQNDAQPIQKTTIEVSGVLAQKAAAAPSARGLAAALGAGAAPLSAPINAPINAPLTAAAPAAAVSAAFAAPKVPTIALAAPPAPAPAPAPAVPQPLNTKAAQNLNVRINAAAPTPAQDVQERQIAHIVTGGLSGR